MATILGITGAIGSGKTTVSHMLAELEPSSTIYESGQLIAELADQFNQALVSELSFELPTSDTELVNQALMWFVEAINEQLHQDVTWNQLAITKHRLAVHPEQYEKLFAYLAAVKANPELAKRPITAENKADYRALLQWLGGYLVMAVSKTIWFDEIFRRVELHDSRTNLVIINGLRFLSDAEIVREHGGLIIGVQRPSIQADTHDITEQERFKIEADVVLINDDSIEKLQQKLYTFWQDSEVGASKKLY